MNRDHLCLEGFERSLPRPDEIGNGGTPKELIAEQIESSPFSMFSGIAARGRSPPGPLLECFGLKGPKTDRTCEFTAHHPDRTIGR